MPTRVLTVFSMMLLVFVSITGTGCASWNSLQGERDALYHQNRQLQEEKDRLAAELEAARSQPAPSAPTAPATGAVISFDGSGFEGISGVEVDTSTAGEVTVRVPGDVLFASGQVTLSDGAKKTLKEVAKALNESYAGRSVVIEGHTDSDPIRKSKWASNEALSEARAQAVATYLSQQGVSGNRISTIGMGASQPRGNDKSKNRRVEIVVR